MENLATIERLENIYPHPDPEVTAIEIAVVGNYHCVVRKGQWHVGDFCVLIQPDTKLPEAEWTRPYGGAVRVKAKRIRGFISYGIIESLDRVVGCGVDTFMGITKYVAPQDISPQPHIQQVRGTLPFNMPRTDETRWQNVRKLPYGQKVWVTLKIDGQPATYGWKDGEFFVCSRNHRIDTTSDNPYNIHARRYNIEDKLASYCQQHGVNLAIRGESYGGKIQNVKCNPHAPMDNGIAFFSVWLLDEFRYATLQDTHNVYQVCRELDLPTIPLLEKSELTEDLIWSYQNAAYLPNSKTRFEGVVMVTESGEHFKVINLAYDELK